MRRTNKVRVARVSNENEEQHIKELVSNELADEELAGMSRARRYRRSMAGCLEPQLAVLASTCEACSVEGACSDCVSVCELRLTGSVAAAFD